MRKRKKKELIRHEISWFVRELGDRFVDDFKRLIEENRDKSLDGIFEEKLKLPSREFISWYNNLSPNIQRYYENVCHVTGRPMLILDKYLEVYEVHKKKDLGI